VYNKCFLSYNYFILDTFHLDTLYFPNLYEMNEQGTCKLIERIELKEIDYGYFFPFYSVFYIQGIRTYRPAIAKSEAMKAN
jgi:hypothetical protein